MRKATINSFALIKSIFSLFDNPFLQIKSTSEFVVRFSTGFLKHFVG